MNANKREWKTRRLIGDQSDFYVDQWRFAEYEEITP